MNKVVVISRHGAMTDDGLWGSFLNKRNTERLPLNNGDKGYFKHGVSSYSFAVFTHEDGRKSIQVKLVTEGESGGIDFENHVGRVDILDDIDTVQANNLFIKCKGSMCDPEIQKAVLSIIIANGLTHSGDDLWDTVSTEDATYDCNIYGDTYGADKGYLNVVLNPIDHTGKTDYENFVGRASINIDACVEFSKNKGEQV